MNVNRVTLSVFGTTGVLLAASLTMLAMVSALVTFDAWPTRGGGATASDVAIQAPAVRVVRAVRRSPAAAAAAAARADGASGAAGAATAAGSSGAAGGGAAGTSSGSTRTGGPYVPSGPPPGVTPIPPGEDPIPGPGPGPGPGPSPDPVQNVVSSATATVCGAASVGC